MDGGKEGRWSWRRDKACEYVLNEKNEKWNENVRRDLRTGVEGIIMSNGKCLFCLFE